MGYVSLYTDGSCDGNPGPGGYAAIIKNGRSQKTVVGRSPHSTNNRMELIAVIKGLSNVKPCSNVVVHTDSAYIEQAVNTGRLATWQQNGWHRVKTGEPVKNSDMWTVLCSTIQNRNLNVKFHKITAHNGHKINEMADSLARQAAKSYVRA